jgi:transposase-like protein
MQNTSFFAAKHVKYSHLGPMPRQLKSSQYLLCWPFAQWGLDMVGKLHKSWPDGYVYMLVAVNKFIKWIEAALVTTQDSTAAVNFIKSIVFCFGVPHSIITDNGTNFTSKEFKDHCESMGIKLNFASVAHTQTNGQVKKANRLICNGIKKRLVAPLLSVPRCRSCASSRNNSRGSQNLYLQWNYFKRSTPR